MDTEQVLTRAAALLVNGRARILRSHRFTGGKLATDSEESKKAEAAMASSGVAPKQKHWIEFRVIDDKTGEPIQGVELTIKLPDGSVEKRTTDAGGYVEINNKLKGDCEVSCEFSELQLPTVYEFVRVG
jgi:hypothetical protein